MRKDNRHFSKALRLGTILLGAFVCYAPIAHAQSGAPIQKKFIEAGWDEPNTASLRANLKEMEKTPFDGVVVTAVGKDDAGKNVSLQSTFSDVPWKQEWFQGAVDDLKAIHPTKLTDNFIKVGANPGNVDWFDDAGWDAIVNHWRIAAWIAKEGNLKGILFDGEPYTKPYKQFQYILQPNSSKYTLEQYQAKARQRGREVISAVAAIDPNLVIYTFFMNSYQASALNASNPVLAGRTSAYNLYPAFINGWLDAAPPTMIFVDGCETSYLYNSQEQYLNAANLMRNGALSFVAPENRAKYAAQVQTSFGMYMDANVNPPTNHYYIDPKGNTRTERLAINATYAINAATEYVWIYGEGASWWPTGNKTSDAQRWEDKLPGITQALLDVTHPQQAAERAVAAAEKNGGKNLLLNADFANEPTKTTSTKGAQSDWKTAGAPANWSTYQDDDSHGTFSFDATMSHSDDKSGAAKITGVASGTFIQSIAVKPGEHYIVQAWTRHAGRGLSAVLVRWQTDAGKWINDKDIDVTMYNPEMPEQNKWQKIQGIATVPAGAGRLVVLLTQNNQPAGNDVAWYDDVSVRQFS